MKQTVIYWGYSAAWKITMWLPEKFAYSIAMYIADFVFKRNGKQIQRLRSNYGRIRPGLTDNELSELTLEGMRSYLRYWCDTFRFSTWNPEKIIATVVVENENFLRDPIEQGRGCIVSLPHAGNWDHAGAYFCSTGIPFTTVAEHLDPEKLFRKFLAHRTAIGMEVLDLNARVLATLAQRLRSGKLVALVADRDLSNSGIPVDFAGGPARMPAGPALLSIQTSAPLITAFVEYEKSGIRIIFENEIPIPDSGTQSEKIAAMTQICADRFAQQIERHTQDWHMLQRIWVDGDFKERDL
ncbi:MAG: phosphatidylinositol mannoside acyltransferase [Actinomycetes bacterium]|jgi:phosphatidylinositol dimannoside acyltransferase